MKWFVEDCDSPSQPVVTTEDAAARAASVLANFPAVAWAIMFGSFARGEQNELSDVDLIVKVEGERTHGKMTEIEDALATSLGRDVDVVTHIGRTTARFLDNINRDGRLIYVRN